MFEILSKNIPKYKRNKFPAHIAITQSFHKSFEYKCCTTFRVLLGWVTRLIVWQSVLSMVFAVLYGFGEHNKKPCVRRSVCLCKSSSAFGWKCSHFDGGEIKIKFENSICKFRCGLLSIAISIFGNLVSDFYLI